MRLIVKNILVSTTLALSDFLVYYFAISGDVFLIYGSE